MFAIFHCRGTTPRANDMLNTSHNEGAITSARSISNQFGILPGPHAFCELRLRRTPTTSSSVSWIPESSPVVDVKVKGDVVKGKKIGKGHGE